MDNKRYEELRNKSLYGGGLDQAEQEEFDLLDGELMLPQRDK